MKRGGANPSTPLGECLQREIAGGGVSCFVPFNGGGAGDPYKFYVGKILVFLGMLDSLNVAVRLL